MTKTYVVGFSARATDQLIAIEDYITTQSGADRARTFIYDIMKFCRGLSTFPERGTRQDHLMPGLRKIGFRRIVTILFIVEERSVDILGVYYGGQDWEAALRDEPD